MVHPFLSLIHDATCLQWAFAIASPEWLPSVHAHCSACAPSMLAAPPELAPAPTSWPLLQAGDQQLASQPSLCTCVDPVEAMFMGKFSVPRCCHMSEATADAMSALRGAWHSTNCLDRARCPVAWLGAAPEHLIFCPTWQESRRWSPSGFLLLALPTVKSVRQEAHGMVQGRGTEACI